MPSGFQYYQSPPQLVVLQTLPTALTSNFCIISRVCVLVSGLGGIQTNPLHTPTCLFHCTEDISPALLSSTCALFDAGQALTSASPADLLVFAPLGSWRKMTDYHRVAALLW